VAITSWTGNSQNIAMQVSLTVTSVATGGTLTATMNGKNVTYTCLSSDTTLTAAAAWQALLANTATSPPEINEQSWSVNGAVVTATASTPGTPFAGMTGGLTSSAAGGAGVTQTTVTPNSSQSDVNNPANWLRAGSPGIPQNGDDVVVASSNIPLLWNLDALAAVTFNSYTRWQSFTGTIGLPVQNPNGYLEYRPTYFQFAGSGAGFTMILGQGQGGGPSRERYNVGSQQTTLVVLASGSAADNYAVCFLGTNAANVITAQNTTLGVAMTPGEVATIASASVDGGGGVALGSGVMFSGDLTLINASAVVNCNVASLDAQQGSQVVVGSLGLTYAAVSAVGGSNIQWQSNSTITALVLQTSSIFDKSQDLRPIVITDSTIDGDTCQINDPGNAITYTNPTTIRNVIQSGPFIVGVGRSVQVI
jgi:hypothetical protein